MLKNKDLRSAEEISSGLRERKVIYEDSTRVVINEIWDLDNPKCPLVLASWQGSQFGLANERTGFHLRQLTMTPEEFRQTIGRNFP